MNRIYSIILIIALIAGICAIPASAQDSKLDKVLEVRSTIEDAILPYTQLISILCIPVGIYNYYQHFLLPEGRGQAIYKEESAVPTQLTPANWMIVNTTKCYENDVIFWNFGADGDISFTIIGKDEDGNYKQLFSTGPTDSSKGEFIVPRDGTYTITMRNMDSRGMTTVYYEINVYTRNIMTIQEIYSTAHNLFLTYFGFCTLSSIMECCKAPFTAVISPVLRIPIIGPVCCCPFTCTYNLLLCSWNLSISIWNCVRTLISSCANLICPNIWFYYPAYIRNNIELNTPPRMTFEMEPVEV